MCVGEVALTINLHSHLMNRLLQGRNMLSLGHGLPFCSRFDNAMRPGFLLGKVQEEIYSASRCRDVLLRLQKSMGLD